MQQINGDDLLWNWARWCWSGETVGNMPEHIPYDDNRRSINHDQAKAVERLHKTLPHHEQMVIIAEYPQKNGFFKDLNARLRREKAIRWIRIVTGVQLLESEYKLYLGLFRNEVERKLL